MGARAYIFMLLLVVASLLSSTQGYRILFFPLSERTHMLVHLRLATTLAERNSTVYFMTAQCHYNFAAGVAAGMAADGINRLKFIPYDMNCTYHEEDKKTYQLIHPFKAAVAILNNVFGRVDEVLGNSSLMAHLENLSPELDFMVNDILSYGMLLASKLKLQYVDLDVGTGGALWEPVFHGAEPSTSFIPGVGTLFSTQGMPFWQRAVNLAATKILRGIVYQCYWHPRLWLQTLIRKHNLPLRWPYNHYMLMLVNSNFVTEPPRAISPNIKYVGPMVPTPAKPLPDDLQQWLDGAGPHGAVYISFGGTLEAPPAAVQTLSKVMQEMPAVRFVLKLRPEVQAEVQGDLAKCTNAFVSDWVPQNDLLAHPNVRLFVTQGGYLSVGEAAYHGVPMLGMPFIPGQGELIRFAEDKGWARRLPGNTLTIGKAAAFKQALIDMLQSDSYSTAAAVTSKRLRAVQRPFNEQAADWVEYAAAVKDHGPFLHPYKIHQYWYQQVMLDVVLLYLAIAAIPLFFFWRRLRMLWIARGCRGPSVLVELLLKPQPKPKVA